jgi:hypothetical protein
MTLKSATMIAMIGLMLAIGLRFILLVQSIFQYARIAADTNGGSFAFSFVLTTVLHFASDLLAYGTLLVFLYVLWTKQQPTTSA